MPSNDHHALIKTFYEAFSRRDAEGMVACYADDVRFSDPVFTDLQGEHAKNMWRMLCERGKDLTVEFRDVTVDGEKGSAHWEAYYTFSATGRKVHNIIDATFAFKNGKIAQHTDHFDLWRWAGLALGPAGKLLGWSSFVKNKIRAEGAKGLSAWEARKT